MKICCIGQITWSQNASRDLWRSPSIWSGWGSWYCNGSKYVFGTLLFVGWHKNSDVLTASQCHIYWYSYSLTVTYILIFLQPHIAIYWYSYSLTVPYIDILTASQCHILIFLQPHNAIYIDILTASQCHILIFLQPYSAIYWYSYSLTVPYIDILTASQCHILFITFFRWLPNNISYIMWHVSWIWNSVCKSAVANVMVMQNCMFVTCGRS
jgi:hypothetical protein